jgi:hypothetical protein
VDLEREAIGELCMVMVDEVWGVGPRERGNASELNERRQKTREAHCGGGLPENKQALGRGDQTRCRGLLIGILGQRNVDRSAHAASVDIVRVANGIAAWAKAFMERAAVGSICKRGASQAVAHLVAACPQTNSGAIANRWHRSAVKAMRAAVKARDCWAVARCLGRVCLGTTEMPLRLGASVATANSGTWCSR